MRCFILIGFNPRTHEGCDMTATTQLFDVLKFQSTHPRGVRLQGDANADGGIEFQSTHPRGVRLGFSLFILLSQSFNPRTHEGCDVLALLLLLVLLQFQSTHPRGVRRKNQNQTLKHYLFQSTHPRGVRPYYAKRK